MRTIEQIKAIIEEKKNHQVEDLVNWLEEIVIPQYINSGQKKAMVYENDRQIGKHFDKLKPIVEEAGYKLERTEIKHTEKRLFGSDFEYISKYISISWE